MKCDEVRKLLPGLALGDLDAEPAREAADHLKSCAECRAAQSEIASAVAALGAVEALGPSAERRDAAVAGMARAQAELAERLLVHRPGRRRHRRAAAAAALLLAAGAVFLWPSRELELKVAGISGRADRFEARTGLWSRLAQGDVVRSGDRLLTANEAVVRLGFRDGSLWINEHSSVAFLPGRRLAIDRGGICAELPSPSAAIAVTDTANNFVSLRQGCLEVGLREVRRQVAGHQEPRAGDPVPPPFPRTEISHELVTRMAEGEAVTFTVGGQPSVARLAAADVAPWRAAGFYAGSQKK